MGVRWTGCRFLETRSLLGRGYRLQGKLGEAEQTLREVQEAQTQLLGSEHLQTVITGYYLVLTLKDIGKIIEGEELLPDIIKRSTKVLGTKHLLVSNGGNPSSYSESVPVYLKQYSRSHC